MFARSFLLIFIFYGVQAFASIQYYSNLNAHDGQKIEVFSTNLDLDNPRSEENQKALDIYRKEIGLDEKSPIIIQALSEQQAQRLGIDGQSISDIEHFFNQYQLKNPVLKGKVKNELAEFFATGKLSPKLKSLYIHDFVDNYLFHNPEAPANTVKEAADFLLTSNLSQKAKQDIINKVKKKNWKQTDEAIMSYRMHTKVEGFMSKLPYAKNLSKSTFALTTIRVIYNGTITTAVTFASTGHVAKSLAYGVIASGVTALIQINSKFFEKLMSGKYWVASFWGIEALVVSGLLAASYMLAIPEKAFQLGGFLVNSILKMGGLTTLTQASAEAFAAKQSTAIKSPLDDEIIRIKNSTKLSPQAKDLILSRLVAARASASEAYARVMVIGSAIWATSLAFEAALPETTKAVAVYGTFAVLGGYAIAIKALGVKKIDYFITKPFKLAYGITKKVAAFRKALPSKIKSLFCGQNFLKN